MKTVEPGDIVRFKKPTLDEQRDLMLIVEWNTDRGFGKHITTGLNFPPVTLLRLEEIEVVRKVDG
jgi:hypothetical protein